MMITRIMANLAKVTADGVKGNIVEAGLVSEKDVAINDHKVVVSVNVPGDFMGDLGALKGEIEKRVGENIPQITNLLVVLTGEKGADLAPATAPAAEPPKLRKVAGRNPGVPGPDMRPAQSAMIWFSNQRPAPWVCNRGAVTIMPNMEKSSPIGKYMAEPIGRPTSSIAIYPWPSEISRSMSWSRCGQNTLTVSWCRSPLSSGLILRTVA